MLDEFQSQFAAGLLKEQATASVSHALRVDSLAFGVHSRNSRLSLRIAIEEVFPITRRLVGIDFFAAMADEFVRAHPPAHGWMSAYGDGFPDFISLYEPAAELGYLPDVARVEWARVHAANAPDDPGLDLQSLLATNSDILVNLPLSLHAAATLIASPFPVFDIWHAHQHSNDEDLPEIDLAKGTQNVLVSRPEPLAVGLALMSPAHAALLSALASHSSFGTAYQAAILAGPDYDLGDRLAYLVRMRALARLNH